MADESADSAQWPVGPPAPWYWTLLTRLLELAVLALTAFWVFNNLGGVAFSPKVVLGKHESTNDTGPIFNWHPIMMSLAFPVFMAEAILAYRAPVTRELDRGQRKILHAALHTAAIVCIIFGIIAAFQSHNLKLPTPIPNLYSPHSYLGMFTVLLSILQYLVGLGGFLYPKLSSRQRGALSPLHMYLGRATFVLGLSTMAVGIQEKTTFMQDGMKLQGPALYRSYLKVPATLELLLALTGIFVLYHHVSPPTKKLEVSTLLDEELQDPDSSS